jgi:hypothetical protein
MRWRSVLLGCALVAGCLLAGCVRADLRPLAVATMVNEADALMEDSLGSYRVAFDARYDGVGEYAEDRFPDWARDRFEACVAWSDEFHAGKANGTSIKGRAWGWVLINRDLDVHILELSYENDETGETTVLISAWEEPTPEQET